MLRLQYFTTKMSHSN